MSITIRWLCVTVLTIATFACGNDSVEPCSAADAAAARCKPAGTPPVVIPPGTILPDWALQLCKDWSRPDGSCDQAQIIADYQDCLSHDGVPEQQRLAAAGYGNRAVQSARKRATDLCMELRRWVVAAPAPNPPPPKPPPS